jgi:hypothetical protein
MRRSRNAFLLDVYDGIKSFIAGRTACTKGDREKFGVECHQFAMDYL